MTLDDIAGYFDVVATYKVRMHFPTFVGATRRDAAMEQGPDSDQVFLPLERERTNDVSGVFDFFATTVFSTVNPGLATTLTEEGLTPAEVCEVTEKVYSVPFVSPATTHVVEVVVHTIEFFESVTTYVTGKALVTAAHASVTDLLATVELTAVGTSGTTGSIGPTGAPVIVSALLAPAVFDATIENV